MAISELILLLILGTTCIFAQDDILQLYGRQQFKSYFQENIDEVKYEFVSPIHIDATGSAARKFKRSTEYPEEAMFSVNAFGENFQILLHKTNDIMAEDMEFTSRNEDGSITKLSTDGASGCYYSGHVMSHGNTPVAVSTCNGLTGLITTRTDDYLIQSVPDSIRSKRNIKEHDHVIFKRARLINITSGYERKERLVNLRPVKGVRQAAQNVVNAPKLTIETAIFLDVDLFYYYQRIFPQDTDKEILKLFLTIMSGVQQLYNDPSLTDKKIAFVVMKFEIFKTRQTFSSSRAGSYLDNFCHWQFTQNVRDDNDPRHWDHAYMFAGVDTYLNVKDVANGLAYVNVMCQPELTCTLCNGRGLVTVFTAAHESGHTFGMQHDSEGNDCTVPANFMMSGGEHVRPWSRCSKAYFTNFLSLPQSVCLLDERQPTTEYNHEKNNNIWIGQCYDFHQQCELSQGAGFSHKSSQEANDACRFLDCVNSDGRSSFFNSHSAYQGSPCGNGMWCYDRKCVNKPAGVKEAPAGTWSNFESSQCYSGCVQGGTGIIISKRKCLHPSNPALFAKCDGPTAKTEKCDDSRVCPRKKTINEIITETCNRYIDHGAKGTGEQALHDDTGGCRIWCYRTNDGVPFENFPNGTPCGPGKFCLANKCTNF